MEIKFEDTKFKILKEIPSDDIKHYFSFNKPNTYALKKSLNTSLRSTKD